MKKLIIILISFSLGACSIASKFEDWRKKDARKINRAKVAKITSPIKAKANKAKAKIKVKSKAERPIKIESYKASSVGFKKAVAHVMKAEGGYSDQENDATGEVRYGITGTTARRNGYKGSMRKLPKSTAINIYKKQYWDKLPNNLSPRAKYIAFDAAVNQGVGYAKKLAVSSNGNVDRMLKLRRTRYRNTAARRPDLRKFLKGWMNRMNHVEKTAKTFKA